MSTLRLLAEVVSKTKAGTTPSSSQTFQVSRSGRAGRPGAT
ncbi:MAG: hypothetical protein R3F59_01125 [Myxococcota bacterium]